MGDPTKLVFSYTVTDADNDSNALAIVGGSLNGATALDTAGQSPDFSGLFTTLPGLQIAVSPTITSVTASPASGIEHIGQAINLTVALSKAVTVVGGTPTLALDDGGTATYDAAATAALGDPTKLVFAYTVAATDQNADTLAIVGGNLNGASITDLAGHSLNPSGVFTSFPGLSIATSTVVKSVTASPASGVEYAGQRIVLTIAMNDGVTVSGGTPTLALNDGGIATYDAAATAALGDPTKLVFDYTVGAGDQTVSTLAIVGGGSNGATITDAAGQVPDFSRGLTS